MFLDKIRSVTHLLFHFLLGLKKYNQINKPLNQLKSFQTEHYTKLHLKRNAESDLLDDFRFYCKQRAAIEREYGQSLQKLINGLLAKSETDFIKSQSTESSSPSNDASVTGRLGESVWDVWRDLLQESNSLAQSRLRSAETHQRMASELKPLRLQLTSGSKRVFDQLKLLQADLATCVQEMVKSHKVYMEEEKQAQDTRMKALTAEQKLNRRSTNIFKSMAHLHRTYDKLVERRRSMDACSALSRNEYKFQLTAINAHLKHYFTQDIPSLAKVLDGDLYDKMRDALSTLCRCDRDLYSYSHKRFDALTHRTVKISRSHAWNTFLATSPLFASTVQYQFDPLDGDETSLSRVHSSEQVNLDQIAHKLARRLVTHERRFKSYQDELRLLRAGCSSSSVTSKPSTGLGDKELSDTSEEVLIYNQEYAEQKLDEVLFAIRREEIEQTKIGACLDLLRNSNVAVDQYLTQTRNELATALSSEPLKPTPVEYDDQGKVSQRHSPSLLLSDWSSIGDRCDYGTSWSQTYSTDTGNNFHPRINNAGVANSTNSLGRVSSFDGHHPAFTSSSSATLPHHVTTADSLDALFNYDGDSEVDWERVWSNNGQLRRATVVKEFRAKRSCEIDLVVNECVVLLQPTDDNVTWIKVRSLIDGNEGIVPISFLQLNDGIDHMSSSGIDSLINLQSFANQSPSLTPTSTISSSDGAVKLVNFYNQSPIEQRSRHAQATVANQNGTTMHLDTKTDKRTTPVGGTFVRTLIDFKGTNSDELTFTSGSIIRIVGPAPVPVNSSSSDHTISRDHESSHDNSLASNHVDDGWLDGELVERGQEVYTRRRGVFPSMFIQPVVEQDQIDYWKRLWDQTISQPIGSIDHARQLSQPAVGSQTLNRNHHQHTPSNYDANRRSRSTLPLTTQTRIASKSDQPSRSEIQYIVDSKNHEIE